MCGKIATVQRQPSTTGSLKITQASRMDTYPAPAPRNSMKRCHSHSYSFSIMEMYGYKNEIIPLSNWLIAVLSTSPFTIIHRTYRAGQPNPAILDLLLSQNRLQGWVQVDSNVLQPVTPVTPVTKTVPPGHPGQIITMECTSTLMCI